MSDLNTHDHGRPQTAPKFGSKRILVGALAAALVSSATFGALAVAKTTGPNTTGMTLAQPASVSAMPATAVLAPNTFSAIADKVLPAVVNIQVEQTAKTDMAADKMDGGSEHATPNQPYRGFPENSPFQEFFEKFFGENAPWQHVPNPGQPGAGQQGPGQKTMGMGSGFIIDADGYVVTNDHVVGQADKITVTLNNGKKYDATLIGRDSKTDLALLKIDAGKPLPFVKWGNSKAAKVGSWVVAVGNPFGLGGTVTTGIVSARGRDINAGPFDDFLQIDASINRGNSGGPTFNLKGEVIGINTVIYSPNGGSVGIGFAVPSSLAQPVIAQLKKHGTVKRGWLGVHIQRVTPEIAESLGLNKDKGALVSKVEPNSPAAKAGLKQGDVILSVNDKAIKKMRGLPKVIAKIATGDKAKLGIWRNGNKKSLDVVIGQMPGNLKIASQSQPKATKKSAFGMTLATLTPQLRAQFQIPARVAGVLITRVEPNSPAAQMGLVRGDVISRVGPKNVTAPGDIKIAIAKAREHKRKAVLILVNRRGNEVFYALKLRKA